MTRDQARGLLSTAALLLWLATFSSGCVSRGRYDDAVRRDGHTRAGYQLLHYALCLEPDASPELLAWRTTFEGEVTCAVHLGKLRANETAAELAEAELERRAWMRAAWTWARPRVERAVEWALRWLEGRLWPPSATAP